MGGRGRGRWRQPTSRWVGLAVAGAYVAITSIAGAALLAAGQQISAADAKAKQPLGGIAEYTDTITVTRDPKVIGGLHSTVRPDTKQQPPGTTTSRTTTTQRTTTTTTPKPHEPAAPAGYRRVTGPGGMTTVVPVGWTPQRTTGPGAMIAIDPANPLRYVKYGGSAAANTDIMATHLLYEGTFAARSFGYQRLALHKVTFHNTDAVDWEFEVNGDGGVRHVRSLYWRERGTEYFVFAADTKAHWAQTAPIYAQLVANATP